MKNDQYLNLCLEQAAQSPLHFRHGSIVVKGGRVIGQGFNDYRPGFDGGSLKTGQLPTAAFPFDDAVIEFKRKRKSKRPDPPTSIASSATFTPFERVSSGGGRHSNTCLSMHSEMMAISSALAASSTLAASTASHFKPCFKLSGRHAKPGRLRGGNDAVKSYVERVCLEAMGSEVQRRTGAASGQEWRFEVAASGCDGSEEQQYRLQSEPESESEWSEEE
jgi:deoxycytidylate deaminase